MFLSTSALAPAFPSYQRNPEMGAHDSRPACQLPSLESSCPRSGREAKNPPTSTMMPTWVNHEKIRTIHPPKNRYRARDPGRDAKKWHTGTRIHRGRPAIRPLPFAVTNTWIARAAEPTATKENSTSPTIPPPSDLCTWPQLLPPLSDVSILCDKEGMKCWFQQNFLANREAPPTCEPWEAVLDKPGGFRIENDSDAGMLPEKRSGTAGSHGPPKHPPHRLRFFHP